jgi:high-affinity Fe2+/Pb2+ permease
MEQNKQNEIPKHRGKLEALDSLSLGISMVVAVAIGVALGLGLKTLTGVEWTLWLGVFYGIAAAGLNVYKAYKKAKKELDKLKDDPKYKHLSEQGYYKEND